VCPDFILRLERQTVTFVHLEVMRWDQHVARAIGRCLDWLAALHGPLYAFTVAPHGADWNKWRNFVSHYGFRFHRTVSYDGVRHSIYVRER